MVGMQNKRKRTEDEPLSGVVRVCTLGHNDMAHVSEQPRVSTTVERKARQIEEGEGFRVAHPGRPGRQVVIYPHDGV